MDSVEIVFLKLWEADDVAQDHMGLKISKRYSYSFRPISAKLY